MPDEHVHDADIPTPGDDFQSTYLAAIRQNNNVIAAYERKYGEEKVSEKPWIAAGAITRHTLDGNHLILNHVHARTEIIWLMPNCMRVHIWPENILQPEVFSYAVTGDYQKPPQSTLETTSAYHSFRSPEYTCRIDQRTGQMTVLDSEQQNLCTVVQTEHQVNGGVRLDLFLAPAEASYGTGERAFDLNLRGRRLEMWNTDPGCYNRGDDPINYVVPLYIGMNNSGCYGILLDNTHRGYFDVGAEQSDRLRMEAERGPLCFYIFCGASPAQVLASYTDLTGRMPIPPLWALGYHQSRYSYMSADELLQVAKTFREREIPCDTLYLDIHYMEGYRIFTWDRERFPDLAATVRNLHDLNMRVVPIIDPGVKVDPGYVGYESGLKAKTFITYPDGEPAAGVVWPGLCHLPDFTNPQVRDWWAEQLQPLLDCGIDGLWNDMNEPLFFGDDDILDPPDFVQHNKEGQGGNHLEMHNVYGMQMARASRAALDKHRAGKRQLVITRAGASGTQRYASSWTGDNYSTWDHIRLSISMVLNMALSGQSFTGPDVGGFAMDTDGELLARFTQACALMPFFRNHSAVDTIHQEPWLFGDDVEHACRKAIELRYQLLPYLYTCFALCARDGHPIVQPVFMAEPKNPELRSIDDSYLLGEQLLVAPVLNAHTLRRNVYLPVGNWYDFWTEERMSGGRIINVEAPLDRLPLFVRAGTVLPLWPVNQYATLPDTVTLRIYPGNGYSRWYEDEGEGLNYQQGSYRWSTFHCEEKSGTLRITRSTNGDYAAPYEITTEIAGQPVSTEWHGF